MSRITKHQFRAEKHQSAEQAMHKPWTRFYKVHEVNSIELFNLIIKNGVKLEFYLLSDELKSDKKIVLEILKNLHYFERCVEDLNHTLLIDKDFILELININSDYFEYAAENLKNDKTIILEAVKNNGNALQWANESLHAQQR